ncbi:MAG: ABC transporter substrate-binding protein [Oscillospiraceae bacterium]|nr:ABC transporter substrate-binding protein [Oscillospiraceae bacterium]
MKKILSLLLALAMIFALAACGQTAPAPAPAPAAEEPAPAAEEPAPAAEEPAPAEAPAPAEPQEITITDMIGREVAVTPGSYKRVVCIGAGALRMYSYVGDVALLCGVEDIDNTSLAERPKMFDSVARPYMLAYGDAFAALPSCGVGGPQAQTAEAEKILACDPDIVISEYEDVEKEDALQEQLGVPVVTLKMGPGGVFDENFLGTLRMLGVIFGEEEKAESLVSFIESERAEIEKRTADVPEDRKPAVYICGLGNWGTTNHLMIGTEKYVAFRVANIKNAVTGVEGPAIQAIEEEKFVDAGEDMDIIIMDAAAVKNIKPLYAENPAMFDTCKAWRDGEVYLEMAYNAYYTNCEIALINTWFIAKTVYPELFEDIDMIAKTDEVTQAFFGMDLSEQIFAAPSSFGGYQKLDTATFFG